MRGENEAYPSKLKRCDVSELSYPKNCRPFEREKLDKISLRQNFVFKRNSTRESFFYSSFPPSSMTLASLSEVALNERERPNQTLPLCASALCCFHFCANFLYVCVCSCFVCVLCCWWFGHLKFIYHIKEIISLVLPW